jgi:hypothetical protein
MTLYAFLSLLSYYSSLLPLFLFPPLETIQPWWSLTFTLLLLHDSTSGRCMFITSPVFSPRYYVEATKVRSYNLTPYCIMMFQLVNSPLQTFNIHNRKWWWSNCCRDLCIPNLITNCNIPQNIRIKHWIQIWQTVMAAWSLESLWGLLWPWWW